MHTLTTASLWLALLAMLLAWLPPAIASDEKAAAPAPVQTSLSGTTTDEVASAEETNAAEIMWEFDPYYTNVGLHIPLTHAAIPSITSDSEVEIYSKLIEGSVIPRYMLLEASVYPMPVLGTYLKRETPDFYRQWEFGKGGNNILESFTVGFQEPWAVSAFFGNIAKLVRPGEKRSGNNMGYTGYLISAGSKHIKENLLIDDDWFELEWKIKGKRNYPNDKLIWSFRIGGKFHGNPDISDVVYASIHRSNLNSNFPFLHWVKNTELELKVHFSQHDGQLVRGEVIAGKKYPLAGKDYTPTLNLGLVWSSPKEYNGVLADHSKSTVTLVFRPSIEF